MNDHFAASASALHKFKTGEINSIEGKPVDILYRVQGSHTKKTRNCYRSPTYRQTKTAVETVTWLVVHWFRHFGNGCNVFVPLGIFLLVGT